MRTLAISLYATTQTLGPCVDARVSIGVFVANKNLNRNLADAKKAKEDEFYTQLPDIERELASKEWLVAAGATFTCTPIAVFVGSCSLLPLDGLESPRRNWSHL